jgi:hypothetical protein
LLPKYEALRFIEILKTGRTRPLIIECDPLDSNESKRKIFVVKAFNLPEVDSFGLYCEAIGSLFAQELGVSTPYSAIIEINQDFVNIVNPILKQAGLNLKSGLGFGSEYLGSGLTSPISGSFFNNEEISQAVDIFSFDLLVQNPDRKPDNPNCIIKSNKFVAIDFNLAFSFLLLIGKLGEPWEFSKHQIARKHLFFQALQGKTIDWKPFVDRVRKLTKDKVDEICTSVPFESERWSEKVIQRFYSVIENIDKLEFELQRSLL